ncbi:MAG: FAD-dependent oxidoreductase, partial [Chroococcales cyanobacterium]
ALEQITTFVKEDNIDCDFSRQNAYTFTQSEDKVEQIKDEVEAALMLGLPASFVTETTLPFSISGAVRFDHQAQFHARKYFLHLAQTIPGDGSYLFEHTRVKGVDEGDPCQIKTERGVVQAKDVIVATNLPILDSGLFFAKTYAKRSYLIGAPIDSDKAPQGMFISTGSEHYRSIRTTPYDGGTLLIIGGEGHKVGTVQDTEERMGRLEAYARSIFNVDEIAYRWSTQDYVSLDKIPFIGKLTPLSNHIYTATGFSLWGMTKGTLSGMLLSDLILGRDNPWMELYDATRTSSFFTGESFKENVDVAAHWVGDRFTSDVSSLSKVGNDEGKIVTVGADKVAAYRDETGELHTCSAVCPHLGCIVHWNSAEKSWDCPCHGSRFTYEGEIIHAPTVKKLEKMNLETRV